MSAAVGERVVSVKYMIKLEPMRNQQLGIDLGRPHGIEEHLRARGIDQARRDGDVTIPEVLKMEIDVGPVHANIGDEPSGRDDLFAQFESRRRADRLNGRIHAAACRHFQNSFARIL